MISAQKGGKIDYATLKDGKPIMLIEFKQRANQLTTIQENGYYAERPLVLGSLCPSLPSVTLNVPKTGLLRLSFQ